MDPWPSSLVSTTIRNHPKYKQALHSYNLIQCIEFHLRKGTKFKDIQNNELLLYVSHVLKVARQCLIDLGIHNSEFDKICHVHISYISSKLLDL